MPKRKPEGGAVREGALLADLDRLLEDAMAGLAETAAWRSLGEDSDPTLAKGLLREAYRRAWAYHRHVFEASTPRIYQRLLPLIDRLGLGRKAREHGDVHSDVDVRHSALLRDCCATAAARHEGAGEAIRYGLRAFAAVYPRLIFIEAHQAA